MRKTEFDAVCDQIEKEVRHMVNGGATRETTIRYIMARCIRANAVFTSKQLERIFSMVL